MTTEERKRELKQQVKDAERWRLIESLPLDIETLKSLLTRLNNDHVCSHTHKETIEFLNERGVDPNSVIPWLKEHGGFCDCEVIYNVYDAVGELVGWHLEEGS